MKSPSSFKLPNRSDNNSDSTAALKGVEHSNEHFSYQFVQNNLKKVKESKRNWSFTPEPQIKQNPVRRISSKHQKNSSIIEPYDWHSFLKHPTDMIIELNIPSKRKGLGSAAQWFSYNNNINIFQSQLHERRHHNRIRSCHISGAHQQSSQEFQINDELQFQHKHINSKYLPTPKVTKSTAHPRPSKSDHIERSHQMANQFDEKWTFKGINSKPRGHRSQQLISAFQTHLGETKRNEHNISLQKVQGKRQYQRTSQKTCTKGIISGSDDRRMLPRYQSRQNEKQQIAKLKNSWLITKQIQIAEPLRQLSGVCQQAKRTNNCVIQDALAKPKSKPVKEQQDKKSQVDLANSGKQADIVKTFEWLRMETEDDTYYNCNITLINGLYKTAFNLDVDTWTTDQLNILLTWKLFKMEYKNEVRKLQKNLKGDTMSQQVETRPSVNKTTTMQDEMHVIAIKNAFLKIKDLIAFQSPCSNHSITQCLQRKTFPLFIFDQTTFSVEPLYYIPLSNLKKSTIKANINSSIASEEKYFNFPPQNPFFEQSHDSNIKMRDLNILSCIATNDFSHSFVVQRQTDGAIHVMRLIEKALIISQGLFPQIRREQQALLKVQHPFLIRLTSTFETNDFLIINFEFCAGGTLAFWLDEVKQFTEPQARFYFGELCLAVQKLHQNYIIHRDIRLDNIYLDEWGHIKLAGFQNCCPNMNYKLSTQTICGFTENMAPEMIQGHTYDYSIDFYNLGTTLYTMVAGRAPYLAAEKENPERMIHSSAPTLSIPSWLSDELYDLIFKLTHPDPHQRLGRIQGISEIWKHEWMKEFNVEQALQKQLSPPILPNPFRYNSGFQASCQVPETLLSKILRNSMSIDDDSINNSYFRNFDTNQDKDVVTTSIQNELFRIHQMVDCLEQTAETSPQLPLKPKIIGQPSGQCRLNDKRRKLTPEPMKKSSAQSSASQTPTNTINHPANVVRKAVAKDQEEKQKKIKGWSNPQSAEQSVKHEGMEFIIPRLKVGDQNQIYDKLRAIVDHRH